MAQFPIRETEILGLGESIITGLRNNEARGECEGCRPSGHIRDCG